uniref:hypothetical protein n=1 Tax=Alistipes sp. TaxID=1872444 RepID=UPI00405650B4
MIISSSSTVKEVMLKDFALFDMAQDRIFEKVQNYELPTHLHLKRWHGDRKLKTRRVSEITMQELDAIEHRSGGFEDFAKTLSVMLELKEEDVLNLRFIEAFRYFIEVNKELKAVAKRWASLKMPLTAKERKAKVKRPNRGMLAVCRQYVQSMNGAITTQEAWETPWVEVYEAFESAYFDALEQRKAHEH